MAEEKQIITGFFREEDAEMLGLSGNHDGSQPQELTFKKEKEALPVLPESVPAGEMEMKTFWRMLRVFFRTGKGGGIDLSKTYPGLLAPYRRAELMQSGYPLWMAESPEQAFAGTSRIAVADMLRQLTAQLAPGESDMKILKDNLPRLEKIIRDNLSFADVVYEARPVFAEAMETLQEQLSLEGEEGKAFARDLDKLMEKLPRAGVMVPYFRNTPLHLLSVFLKQHRPVVRQSFELEVRNLSARLDELLAAEREKSPEARSAGHLHDTLDFAGTFLNFNELSSVLPSGSEDAIPEERLKRIDKIQATLKEAPLNFFASNGTLVIDREIAGLYELDWDQQFSGTRISQVASGTVCAKARKVFDEKMVEAARLFGAVRLAKLELDNRYQPEIHADFFAHFDWRAFTDDELSACPPVVVLANTGSILQKELNEWSDLLSSGRPLKMLALTLDTNQDIDAESAPLHDPLVFRQEPGALAVAHRNTYVLQATPVDPDYILKGFEEGFGAGAPALFHLFAPADKEDDREDLFLRTSAAVESREFPSFTYHSERGPKWGSRFDLQNNPQVREEWPVHRMIYRTAEGEDTEMTIPFTFADYAGQDARFAAEFQPVSPGFWTDELVPLHEFLTMSREEQFTLIPYVWMVDEKQVLHKVAVSWKLALTCLERLDFWHYLQENAGIHSYHVEQATERLRRDMEEAFSAKLADMKAGYEKEMQKISEETARAAMEKLAATLLDMDAGVDLTAPVQQPASRPAPKVAEQTGKSEPAPAKEEPAPEPRPEEEEDLSLGEAWIDTPLCTSCNECIDLNKRIFQYNADKQAYVADPKGGPFSDIVKAAESCPVAIIHPGAPQHPNEPDLKEWIKRAERFQ